MQLNVYSASTLRIFFSSFDLNNAFLFCRVIRLFSYVAKLLSLVVIYVFIKQLTNIYIFPRGFVRVCDVNVSNFNVLVFLVL